MVRDHDCISPDLHRAAGIASAHHAFEAEGAAPVLPDARGHIPIERLIEHIGKVTLDRYRLGAAGAGMAVQIGQAELLTQQVIQRPARFDRVGQERTGGEAGRRAEAAPQAAFTLAADDGINCQRQTIELCLLAALDHRSVQPLVLVDIELEHLGVRAHRANLFDGHRGEAGYAKPQAKLLCRRGNRALALPVKYALERSGGEDQRQGSLAAQHGDRSINLRHPGEHIWHQIGVGKGGGVARAGQFIIGRTIDVIEHRPWQAAARQFAEIGYVVAVREAQVSPFSGACACATFSLARASAQFRL